MIFSLAFLTLYDCTPEQAIRAAAAAGYDRVGLRLLPATSEEPDYPLLYSKRMLVDVLSMLDDYQISVGEIELVRLGTSSSMKSLEQLLERAAELGAHDLVVVNDDPIKSRFSERFSELCERAAQYNLTVNLEPMTWTAIPDLATASDWLANVSHANIGILVDTLHYHRGKSSLEQFRSIPDQQINLFQICDAKRDFDPSPLALRKASRQERLLPGEGELELLPLLRSLPDKVTISIEVPNAETTKLLTPCERADRALRATKSLLGKLQ